VNDLTTAREALLGEMLGDVATLVGRLEAIAPMLDASREPRVDRSNGRGQRSSVECL
jgi:hypothetical protein